MGNDAPGPEDALTGELKLMLAHGRVDRPTAYAIAASLPPYAFPGGLPVDVLDFHAHTHQRFARFVRCEFNDHASTSVSSTR